MFPKKKITHVVAEKSSADLMIVKYQKPKVLLVDLDDEDEKAVRKEGFNASIGTFGQPYKVSKSSSFLPVIVAPELPNYSEQEVVVVDLMGKDPTNAPKGEKQAPAEELDWWAKCATGVIDPRPRGMLHAQKGFDRTLANGGIFVIFADARDAQGFVWAKKSEFGGLETQSDLKYDNWSMLSLLDHVSVHTDRGEEISLANVNGSLGQLLGEHLGDATFSCTITCDYQIKERWTVLAKNKFGAAVAGVISPPENSDQGWILLFPRMGKERGSFIAKLIKNVLPELSPGSFPDAEGQKWVHRAEYELPRVLEIVKAQDAIAMRAQSDIAALAEQLETERQSNGWIHELLTGTDAKLVNAVKSSLSILGFTSVVDSDEERDRDGKSRREDLQVTDTSPTLIIDVKGIGGFPSDEDALQADKHAVIRIREQKRTDIIGLSIINHQRHLPPLDRENEMPFRQELLEVAEEQSLGLMTSWDLYRLVRNSQKLNWPAKSVLPLLYRKGRISTVPDHYKLIGNIAKAWTEKFGVVIADNELNVGDRIAIEFSVEFEEIEVASIKVDDKDVSRATVGDRAGLIWSSDKPKPREGLRVFRVVPSAN